MKEIAFTSIALLVASGLSVSASLLVRRSSGAVFDAGLTLAKVIAAVLHMVAQLVNVVTHRSSRLD